MNRNKRLGNDFRRRQKSGQRSRKRWSIVDILGNRKAMKSLRYRFKEEYDNVKNYGSGISVCQVEGGLNCNKGPSCP